MADYYVDNNNFQTAPAGMQTITNGCTINAGDNTQIDSGVPGMFNGSGAGEPFYVLNTGYLQLKSVLKWKV